MNCEKKKQCFYKSYFYDMKIIEIFLKFTNFFKYKYYIAPKNHLDKYIKYHQYKSIKHFNDKNMSFTKNTHVNKK